MLLRDRLRRGDPVVGVLNPIASTDMAELLGTLGFDFVMMDMEHGSIDVSQLPDLTRAIRSGGSVPLVRVPDHDPKRIMRTFDAGMIGTMVPQVDTPAEAAAVVAAHRESGICIVQVETAAGLDAAGAIAATPGVDAVLIGPFDLSVSLGHPGQPDHPDVQAAIVRIAAACVEAGRVCGIYCTPAQAARYRALGMTLFLTGAVGLLREAAAVQLGQWREAFRA